MHEQSLMKTLLQQVERIRREQGCCRVTEVRVELGPLSGVEPWLLSQAFDLLAPQQLSLDASLVMEEVPLMGECASCEQQFEIVEFVFRCPSCQGPISVTRGDELRLVSVSLDGQDAPQEQVP